MQREKEIRTISMEFRPSQIWPLWILQCMAEAGASYFFWKFLRFEPYECVFVSFKIAKHPTKVTSIQCYWIAQAICFVGCNTVIYDLWIIHNINNRKKKKKTQTFEWYRSHVVSSCPLLCGIFYNDKYSRTHTHTSWMRLMRLSLWTMRHHDSLQTH